MLRLTTLLVLVCVLLVVPVHAVGDEEDDSHKSPRAAGGSAQVGLHVTYSNHNLLRNGSVWFVKFHASWCGACRSIAAEWDALSDALDFVRLASVDVDRNRALAEVFGVKRIPSFFLVASSGEVLQYTESLTLAPKFIAEALPVAPTDTRWLRGAWNVHNPMSHLWRPFVALGTLIDRVQTIFKAELGLTTTQTIVASVVLLLVIMAAWTVLLYIVLGKLCPIQAPGEQPVRKGKAKKD